MTGMRTIETRLSGEGMRIGVIVARFNHLITRRLLEGCETRLRQLGCEEMEVMWVPGAFEVPLGAQEAARSGRYDALVAIAVLVRGETPHFEYICRGVTDGVRQVGLEQRIPVAFGVLTTETMEQALVRAAVSGEPGINKGSEAAEVVVEMTGLLAQLGTGS